MTKKRDQVSSRWSASEVRSVHEFDRAPAVHPGDQFEDQHVATAEQYAQHVISNNSSVGDTVVDPFAGFGTMLLVAERLDRIPIGIEFDREKVRFVRDQLDGAGRVHHGSAMNLSEHVPGTIDLCFTSPPYMARDSTADPFQNYDGESSYGEYLSTLTEVFTQLAEPLSSDGMIVIDVSNLRTDSGITTLAWDIVNSLSDVASFRGENVITWRYSTGGYGYDFNYCLFFSGRGD